MSTLKLINCLRQWIYSVKPRPKFPNKISISSHRMRCPLCPGRILPWRRYRWQIRLLQNQPVHSERNDRERWIIAAMWCVEGRHFTIQRPRFWDQALYTSNPYAFIQVVPLMAVVKMCWYCELWEWITDLALTNEEYWKILLYFTPPHPPPPTLPFVSLWTERWSWEGTWL